MRILAFFLISFAFVSSCSKTQDYTESNSEPEILISPNSRPILEIQQDAVGMWDVTGKLLFFRLYENGVAEFEFVDEKKRTKEPAQKFENISAMKRIKLKENELEQFIVLLNSEHFQEIQNSYQRKCCCTDATLTYKTKLKSSGNQREIVLENYCDIYEIINARTRNVGDMPKSLSNLFSLIMSIKTKNTPQ